MKLTDAQKEAIVSEIAQRFESIVEDPVEDYDCLDFYEDSYGNSMDRGSCNISGEIEEVCRDGLPGIDPEKSDIGIYATYSLRLKYHDDYDEGDYWTPPSGGIEIDDVSGTIDSIDIDGEVYNEDTGDWDFIEVSKEEESSMIKEINNRVFGLESTKVA